MNDIKYNGDKLLEKQFSVVNKGYSPREVDEFLDEIIQDYESINEIEDYYKVQNIALQKTNSVLRGKIDELETKLEIEKNKNSSIEKVDSTSNLDLIKKIAKLESELFQTKQELEEAKK